MNFLYILAVFAALIALLLSLKNALTYFIVALLILAAVVMAAFPLLPKRKRSRK